MFANNSGDQGSIPGWFIAKIQKIVLNVPLLSNQHYKVRIKGKVEQSREWSKALPYILVLKLLKREPSGNPRLRSPILLTYIYHHHHVVPPGRISLTLSRHFSLSFIAFGRSSGLHTVSSHSCCMYVRGGRPAFAWPYVGVHRSTSLMSSSLLLQQCPVCLVRLTCIVFVMEGRWPYSWCLVGMLTPGLVQYCSQHSWVIAV